MKASFVRARRPEQKAERRAHLLATARAILAANPDLASLSLTELARQADMVKANVYRYFETREAVLLALLEDELTAWAAAFLREHARPRTAKLEVLVRRLARSLAERPLLCALVSALPSVMERNLSEEAIRGFKTTSLTLMREASTALVDICPALDATAYARLLYDAMFVVTGLYPHAYPTPAAARVLEDPAFAPFRKDFAVELERLLQALALAAASEREA